MKKILIPIAAILLVIIVLSGCGGKETLEKDNNNYLNQDSNININGEDSDDEDKGVSIENLEEKSGMGVNVNLGKSGNNMSLPEEFPKDALPLTDDANIINVNDTATNIGIIYETNKSYSDAVDFYKEAIEEADVEFEGEGEDSYVAWGSIDDYSFSISISSQSATKTIIMLDVNKR